MIKFIVLLILAFIFFGGSSAMSSTPTGCLPAFLYLFVVLVVIVFLFGETGLKLLGLALVLGVAYLLLKAWVERPQTSQPPSPPNNSQKTEDYTDDYDVEEYHDANSYYGSEEEEEDEYEYDREHGKL